MLLDKFSAEKNLFNKVVKNETKYNDLIIHIFRNERNLKTKKSKTTYKKIDERIGNILVKYEQNGIAPSLHRLSDDSAQRNYITYVYLCGVIRSSVLQNKK